MCVPGPGHLLSVGLLAVTLFLGLVTTPSVGNADVAESKRKEI